MPLSAPDAGPSDTRRSLPSSHASAPSWIPRLVTPLCPVCSTPMEGHYPGPYRCLGAEAEPEIHGHLERVVRNWRAGVVQGRTLATYSRTVSLLRRALDQAVLEQQERAHARRPDPRGHAPPAADVDDAEY